MDVFHQKQPKEVSGRDTLSRFRMQHQAAAYNALEILKAKEIDRVYCDYHDDFVVRYNIGGTYEYHFFQVKTKSKSNQQWKIDEIFSIKKRTKKYTNDDILTMRNSFAGKLFAHTIEFGHQCREISILSNIHFSDEVENFINELKKGSSSKEYIQLFIDNFDQILSSSTSSEPNQLNKIISKFSLLPNVRYIDFSLQNFTTEAREAIWSYSEIDLSREEIDQIAKNLISLVANKSCEQIHSPTKESIENASSVGIEDLLKILSISTEVYNNLIQGDDPSAIKTASILQRTLKKSGASEQMIEIASRAKIKWDEWLRTNRHVFLELDLCVLLEEIDKKCQNWIQDGGKFSELHKMVNNFHRSESIKIFSPLDKETLFGGFLSSIVRIGSQ